MKDDAISRAEAIRIASGYCHYTNIPKELEKLPSVQPEPKTGNWIKLPYMAIEADGTLLFSYECSSCKGIGYFRRSEGDVVGGLFCPNCGAKMGGSEQDE